jgi:hypothetical protein
LVPPFREGMLDGVTIRPDLWITSTPLHIGHKYTLDTNILSLFRSSP